MYKRVLIKLSGEALSGKEGFGIDQNVLKRVIDQIAKVVEMKVQIGIVIGGGNFWRGRQGTNMDRTTADQDKMLPPLSMRWLCRTRDRRISPQDANGATITRVAEPYILRKLSAT